MPLTWIIVIVLALAALGLWAGPRRALGLVDGKVHRLHSRPPYYGWSIALLVLVPAFLLLIVGLLAKPLVLDLAADAYLPAGTIAPEQDRGLVIDNVRYAAGTIAAAIADGTITPSEAAALTPENTGLLARMEAAHHALLVAPDALAGANEYRRLDQVGTYLIEGGVLVLALAGFVFGLARISPTFRARNMVERAIGRLLVLCSGVAIATTLAIILSLVFESAHFFRLYPWRDFLFGTEWLPRFGGGSELGILPLLWGTLYISLIALLVAVPVGLFAAIYLSEYASNATRTLMKPVIEILAGIPTIVYGLFALMTVGPLLRDWVAAPLHLGTSASSVMTAGLVMGVMLVPFVSSLSDDIIRAVPQSLRDACLGLGSTHSETIRHVVLPAALPGIVGAVLLAASRAIGETMIVVLGAGAMARISGNPFEAMTTITVKIVGQLTGDNDFASPETLVAFALALTLFVITLVLNVFALWVVRRFREQYE